MKFAFPDEGAFKRFGKLLELKCPQLYHGGNVVICGKVRLFPHNRSTCHARPPPPAPHAVWQTRVGDDRRIWITDGDPKGAHVSPKP